jgi:lipid-A-disaccharide synthase-like uncharacterized protein
MAWLVIGGIGQVLFTARFLIQWIASEIRKKSVVPKAFWWFSIAGGLVLLAYAIHKEDPVFILGQAGGLVVYLRNLIFLRRDGSTAVERAT